MIYNYEIERYCIASILKYPALYNDIGHIIGDQDFHSKLNRTVYSIIRRIVSEGGELNDYLIIERLQNLKIRFEETELQPAEYLDSLRLLQVTEKAAVSFFKKLKQITVRREISEVATNIQRQMKAGNDSSIEEIIAAADLAYTEKISQYELAEEFPNIFDTVEDMIESRGNNPVSEIGLMGPFPKVNELYGSLLRDGAITVLGARTGIGKTQFGLFYSLWVAEKYNVPILHLDQGEMSIEELQYRAVSMFTGGKVSYDALERGYWRNSAEATSLVRAVWPKVKRIRMEYHDVSLLEPSAIVSLCRRYYLRKIGRGNKFITHYDYLKAFDTSNADAPEWKEMGSFIKQIKNLYKNELVNPFWTSIQLNRTGISGNKNSSNVDDTENTFGVSDRVAQQATHAILLRPKLHEELAEENSKFGNTKAIFVKHRHLGENYAAALTPVKLPSGKLTKNFVHFDIRSFHIEEKGDLASTVSQFGQLAETSEKNVKPADKNCTLEDPFLE